MRPETASHLNATIPDGALVVDIGGGASPFPRADYVIDAVNFENKASLGIVDPSQAQRYSKETWVQVDLCEHKRWPFEDDFFDYAVCSHLLEDVRDPIWICAEMCRVAKAGYIEVPSRITEQSLGIEHPRYAGFYHHRWLVDVKNEVLEFRHKPHSLHCVRDAIVANLGASRRLNPKYEVLTFEWEHSFKFQEVLEFDESRVVNELCTVAQKARLQKDLTLPRKMKISDKIKRWVYFRRLARGAR